MSRSFFIIHNSKEITKEIISGLEINTENPSAQTIGISHEHTNLKFSQDICDGLVEVYMDYELEKKQISSDKVVAFINIQKDSIRKKLIENEKKLRRFRKKNIYASELNVIKEKKNKYQIVNEELLTVETNIELLNQFDLMFSNNLSLEINSNSIKNITL